MKEPSFIKKILAAWLLICFAISAAPKVYFHDLLASHRDRPACEESHSTAAVHHQSFNCHCDDLVVSSLFLCAQGVTTPDQPTIHRSLPTGEVSSYSFAWLAQADSRGPPPA